MRLGPACQNGICCIDECPMVSIVIPTCRLVPAKHRQLKTMMQLWKRSRDTGDTKL